MKTFKVQSAEWVDEVEVDDSIFDEYNSQAAEAMAISLEKWLSSDDNYSIGVLTLAHGVDEGPTDDASFIMHSRYVFENIGRLDMAKKFDQQLEW